MQAHGQDEERRRAKAAKGEGTWVGRSCERRDREGASSDTKLTSCCDLESCIETVTPVGMWVRRIADSVLLTCCGMGESQHTIRQLSEGNPSYLSTGASRAHDFDLDVLLVEQVVVHRRRACWLRREDLEV